MFYVCENQLVFSHLSMRWSTVSILFPSVQVKGAEPLYEAYPVVVCDLGCVFAGLCFFQKKTKGKSFSHFIITSLHLFFVSFLGGPRKSSGNLGIIQALSIHCSLARFLPQLFGNCHGSGENRCGSRGCGGCHGEGGPAGSGNYTAETWIDGSLEVDNQ